jgi:hypothetical protein
LYSQAQNNNNNNNNQLNSRSYSFFDTDTPSSPNNVRVQYSVAQGIGVLSVYVDVDTPFTLNLHIVDANGNEFTSVESTNILRRFGYGRNWDVSSLPTGPYYLEFLYGDNNSQRFRVPFYKE